VRQAQGKLLRILFAYRMLATIAILALGSAGYVAYTHVGTGFLPRMDEGGFVLDYQTAPGTSLSETNRELTEIEAILKKNPHVYTYSRRTGAGLGGDLAESYQGDFFVCLVAPSLRPPIWMVMDDVTNQITNQVPGISFDTHQLLDDMIGDIVSRSSLPSAQRIRLAIAGTDFLEDEPQQLYWRTDIVQMTPYYMIEAAHSGIRLSPRRAGFPV
jgi:multidrug efflux pump subunit AcrB